MIRKYADIFCWKNVSSFCSAKATHIFSAKNIRILYIESAKTVNEMTLNELVKLTTLWTTGPWCSSLPNNVWQWYLIPVCEWWKDENIITHYQPVASQVCSAEENFITTPVRGNIERKRGCQMLCEVGELSKSKFSLSLKINQRTLIIIRTSL